MSVPDAVAATEENLWSMWASFGRGEGCTLVDTPEVLRFETPIAHIPYNSVMRFRVDEADVEATIDATLERYTSRRVPLMWVVHPTAAPRDVDRRLEKRGLVENEVAPGMIAELSTLPPPDAPPDGVDIGELGPALTDPFIELVAFRYSLPPEVRPTLRSIMEAEGFARPGARTRAWIAMRDGVVVSKAVLHVGAGVAGIYGVATRPEARGLGLARTLTLRALHAARDSGLTAAILHSTPMARSLYESIGFRVVAEFRLYSTPDTLHL
jgi:GNAT superfamily N-acetyltransferase